MNWPRTHRLLSGAQALALILLTMTVMIAMMAGLAVRAAR